MKVFPLSIAQKIFQVLRIYFLLTFIFRILIVFLDVRPCHRLVPPESGWQNTSQGRATRWFCSKSRSDEVDDWPEPVHGYLREAKK